MQLARRENFFSDPFFSDFMSLDDDEFSKKLASFKEKSSTVALSANKGEAAHNLQVNFNAGQAMMAPLVANHLGDLMIQVQTLVILTKKECFVAN